MIRNFVFDMGNVIIQWNPQYIVSQYTNNKEEIDYLVKEVFQSQEWLDFDHGTMTRTNVIAGITKRIGIKYHDTVTNMIMHWYRHCPVIQEMMPIIKELKEKGYGIYLLSNTNIHFDEYCDSIETLKYFDGYYISAKSKLVKPNIEIFEDFVKEFYLHASECLFIDDIQENIVGAKKANMQGYHFTGDCHLFENYLISHGYLK